MEEQDTKLQLKGLMPYTTTEGQLSLEFLSKNESVVLEEIQHVEPLEYTD